MKLLVAIHDVSPANESGVRTLWRMVRARGVQPALLVVPNWHGMWPLERYPEFAGWVRECAHDGAEIFLHGERHDEAGSERSAHDQWRAFLKTRGEAEFLSLAPADARERIERGLAVLEAQGLCPVGFVPPAWLARKGWLLDMCATGIRISEDEHAVHLHERGMRIDAPVTRWSARTQLRAQASSWLADARLRYQQHVPLMRVALHPADLSSHVVRSSLERTLDRWLATHQPFRYEHL